MAIEHLTKSPQATKTYPERHKLAAIQNELEPIKKQRPTLRRIRYTPKLFTEICNLVAQGQTLITICERADMPDRVTVYRWLQESPDLYATYTHAKQIQADYYVDSMIAVIDNAASTRDEIERAKVKIETLKWAASKLKPRMYGDKLDITSDGERIEQPIYGGASVPRKQAVEGQVVKPKQLK